MAIQLLNSGPLISVQDSGRFLGLQDGIPLSGVMDKNLFFETNRILKNEINLPSLEIFMQNFQIKFTKNTCFSVGAYDAEVYLNKDKIDLLKAYSVKSGDILKIKKINKGVWSYLSVKDGFKSSSVLGSCSRYEKLNMQAFKNKNDLLDYDAFEGDIQPSVVKLNDFDHFRIELDCVALPESKFLSETVKYQLFNAEFTLSRNSNRQAYQLNERLNNTLSEITTGAVLPGTVQLTSGGHLMILMRDSQVTGGYPRVLQVKENSLSRLSQMRPDAKIKFRLSKEF
ncbi:5-oxoprolinase subunit C family protein [Psychroflexus halocasei]|uniref:Biotin-dependent carboxylase uncharacterized domain-containing protein n=1 Tax=Psychroflexus halocasei TaxID=908615 RepID=A0A1H3WVA1_9FLAO|nr:biotin-dependent carboxyltransferase family protein [Psychroflexus halocasei]SDZ91107.1 biotin-dependent carboxylase uncharacterized domain-containing protein [Psychroflexus halocasei]